MDTPPQTQPAHDSLVRSLSLIDLLTTQACRRHRLSADESEEFGCHVRLKLVEDDCAILAKFRQSGSLKAYLRVVIERLLLDFRSARWGRWRPSNAARRHGRVGVLLERLMMRDGLTFDEAFAFLQVNYQFPSDRDELYRVSVRLPVRPKRCVVHEIFGHLPATHGSPEDNVARDEAGRQARRLKTVLKAAIRQLPPEDRRLLDMRYREGRPIVDIARALGEPSALLYRRLAQIVRKIGRPVRAAAVGLGGIDIDQFQLADVSISW